MARSRINSMGRARNRTSRANRAINKARRAAEPIQTGSTGRIRGWFFTLVSTTGRPYRLVEVRGTAPGCGTESVVGMQRLAGKLDAAATRGQGIKQAIALLRVDDGLYGQTVHAFGAQRQLVVAVQKDAIHNVGQKGIGDRGGAVVVQHTNVFRTNEKASGTCGRFLAQVQPDTLYQYRAIVQGGKGQPVG